MFLENSVGFFSFGGIKRFFLVFGYFWRFKKSKLLKIQSILKIVWFLDKLSEEVEIGIDGEFDDYFVIDDMVLLKGEFDLLVIIKMKKLEENQKEFLIGNFLVLLCMILNL